jgi:hypothetical protein
MKWEDRVELNKTVHEIVRQNYCRVGNRQHDWVIIKEHKNDMFTSKCTECGRDHYGYKNPEEQLTYDYFNRSGINTVNNYMIESTKYSLTDFKGRLINILKEAGFNDEQVAFEMLDIGLDYEVYFQYFVDYIKDKNITI